MKRKLAALSLLLVVCLVMTSSHLIFAAPIGTLIPVVPSTLRPVADSHNLRAIVKDQSVVLQWDLPLAVSRQRLSYHLYRSTTSDNLIKPANRLSEFALSGSTFTDHVIPGVYYYALQTINALDGTLVSNSAPIEVQVIASTPATSTPTTSQATPSSSSEDALYLSPSFGIGPRPAYLSIEGIPGPINLGWCIGGIIIQEFDWTPASVGETGAPRSALTVEKQYDQASAPLAAAIRSGNTIPQATLTVCERENQMEVAFFRIVMKDLQIAQLSHELFPDVGLVKEVITLQSDRVRMEYRQKSTGSWGDWVAMDYVPGSETASDNQGPALAPPNLDDPIPGGTYGVERLFIVSGAPGSTKLNTTVAGSVMEEFHFIAPKATLPTVSLRKILDLATVPVVQAFITERHFPHAALQLCQGPQGPRPPLPFYRIKMTDITVDALTISYQVYEGVLWESLELSYGDIQLQFRTIDHGQPSSWVTVDYPQ